MVMDSEIGNIFEKKDFKERINEIRINYERKWNKISPIIIKDAYLFMIELLLKIKDIVKGYKVIHLNTTKIQDELNINELSLKNIFLILFF